MTSLERIWKTRIGIWNLRTLIECGKLKQVEKEMTNYKFHITGLSDVRWQENGEIKSQNGNALIFSGVGKDTERRNGMGILMNKEARRSIMEWSPISERIILGSFKTKIRILTIIQCYAPKEMTGKDVKKILPSTASNNNRKSIKGCNNSDGRYECQNWIKR